MKLTDLEPGFIRCIDESRQAFVDSLSDAQGMMFTCPQCFPQGKSHTVLVWFKDRGVGPNFDSHIGRWPVSGTTTEDLTLTGSVLPTSCGWHGYITNGEVTTC